MINLNPTSLKHFFENIHIETFDINNDETKGLISMNLEGSFKLWGIDLSSPFPYLLSTNSSRIIQGLFDKQNRWIIVVYENSEEQYAIGVIPINGGEITPLVEHNEASCSLSLISTDGNRLYYTSDKYNSNFFDIFYYDITKNQEVLLQRGKDAVIDIICISPNEESYVYLKYYSNTSVKAVLVKNGIEIELFKDIFEDYEVKDVSYIDEENLIISSNVNSDRFYLTHLNLNTMEYTQIFKLLNKDVNYFLIDNQNKWLYCLVSVSVQDELWRYSITNKEIENIEFPGSVIWDFAIADSGSLYAVISSENSPQNLFVQDKLGEWRRITNNKIQGVEKNELITSKTLLYPTFDGKTIEALWYEAKLEKANGYTIIMPHGGPQSLDRKSYWSFLQALLFKGYNVFMPNFRGSTGYGAAFAKLVEKDWGNGPIKDILSGIDYLISHNFAYANKLLMVGISYGGYLSLLFHGKYPSKFEGFVSINGPNNLLTFIESVPDYWKQSIYELVGHPVYNRQKLIKDSPVTYINNMTKPMLVIQGAEDIRVTKFDTDQFINQLKEINNNLEYIVIEEEGHNFTQKHNELIVFQNVISFLEKLITK